MNVHFSFLCCVFTFALGSWSGSGEGTAAPHWQRVVSDSRYREAFSNSKAFLSFRIWFFLVCITNMGNTAGVGTWEVSTQPFKQFSFALCWWNCEMCSICTPNEHRTDGRCLFKAKSPFLKVCGNFSLLKKFTVVYECVWEKRFRLFVFWFLVFFGFFSISLRVADPTF